METITNFSSIRSKGSSPITTPILARHWHLFVLSLSAASMLLWGLGRNHLRDWDEAIYAQISKEIVQSGQWLTLHHGYQTWFEKPPLFMWTTAVFYHLFGINEFWSRASSAFSGILLLIITYFIGKLLYGRWVGFLAGIILLSTHEFPRHARLGMTDVMFTFFIFLAIYAYLRLESGNQKWWYPFWVSLASAVMVKSMATLILPVTVATVLMLEKKVISTLRSRHFWRGGLIAAAIIFPWHILMYARHGDQFIDIYFVYHLFTRATVAIESHTGGPLFYLDALRRGSSPWFYMMPFAIALGIKDNLERQSKSSILLVFVIVVVGVYTFLVRTKIEWYIYPVFPAFAILIAASVSKAYKSFQSTAFGGLICASLISTLISQNKLLYLFLFVVLALIVVHAFRLVREKRTYQLAVIFIFVFWTSISAIGMVRRNNRIPALPIYSYVDSPSIVKIANIAGNLNPDQQEPLIGLALEDDIDTPHAVEGPTAVFYSGRPVKVAWTLDQLRDFTLDQGIYEIIMAKKYVQSLSAQYEIKMLAQVEPLVYGTIEQK